MDARRVEAVMLVIATGVGIISGSPWKMMTFMAVGYGVLSFLILVTSGDDSGV